MHIVEFLGYTPFLIYFVRSKKVLSFHKLIPLIIYINGFQHHFLFSESKFARSVDVYSNVIMVSYMNYYTTDQPRALIGTATAFCAFILNQQLNSVMVHVIFVQWFLLHLYAVSHVRDKDKRIFYGWNK
jgi:hypothetical protein